MVRLDPQTAHAVVHDLQGNPALIVLFAVAMVAVAAVAAFGCAKGAKKKPREKSSVQYYGGYTAAPKYTAPSAGKSAKTGSSSLATGLAAGAVTAMAVDTMICSATAHHSASACGGGGGGGCGGGGCGGGGCGGGGCGGC